jgi:hypothetical protein
LELEVDEVPVAKSPAVDFPNSAAQPVNEPNCYSLDEAVEDSYYIVENLSSTPST